MAARESTILTFKETISKIEIREDLLIAFQCIHFQHLQIHPYAFNMFSAVDWLELGCA